LRAGLTAIAGHQAGRGIDMNHNPTGDKLTRRTFIDMVAGVGALAATAPASAEDNVQLAATPASPSAAASTLSGKITYRGESRYETLRQAASWNARKPNRFPNAIVLAESEADVIEAVRLATQRGWQVTARSGGHSWSASHTRDNSLQINLARMKQIEIDPQAGIARISPSIYGNTLNKLLREQHQLFTPSAHGVNVGMGGFVMCGGHGWNSRVFGLGCENLMALDLVNARGEFIHASDTENSDYYWGARGAGPGFFGIATRYYLRLHPKPQVMKSHGYTFAIDEVETLVAWVRDHIANFPPILEVVMLGKLVEGVPTVVVIGNCLGGTDKEVDAALALLETCPVMPRATSRWAKDIVVPYDVEPSTDSNPTGARFAVDNIWTNASSSQLVPFVKELFSDLPTPKSYVFLQVWGPVRKLPDMAYSVQGDIYISSNAVYYEPDDDARCEAWAVAAMRKLDSIALGAQMNDENMAHHPARYLSEAAAAKLESLRRQHDPEGRFPGFQPPQPLATQT
jgi:FAD/FMN-containing dehydrogenase